MLTVVKVGGGLGDGALRALCAALGELGERHPLLVVPGGAGFADAVRDADRRFGLSADAAHRMAILGMEQFGWLLQRPDPGRRAVRRPRAPGAGRTTVLLPAALPLDALPASWQVTSDSIAAWVAGRVGAGRLVLVKEVDGLYARLAGPRRAARAPDRRRARARCGPAASTSTCRRCSRRRFETWVIGGRDRAAGGAARPRAPTVGTRIAPACYGGFMGERQLWERVVAGHFVLAKRSFWPNFFSRIVARLQWNPVAIDLAAGRSRRGRSSRPSAASG